MATVTRHRVRLRAILAICERQHGVITRAQLLDAGLSPAAIRHRVDTGRLRRLWPSVYGLWGQPPSQSGRWLAAVFACGPGAVLGRLSAGALWEVWERTPPAQSHVCVPTDAGRRQRRGIVVHRTALARDEVTARDAIPVTTLPRTLLDLAAMLDERPLRSALRQAERLHRLDLRLLRDSLQGAPPSSVKHARLRRALATYVPGAAQTEADAEMAFLELCAAHRLPPPECQVPVGRYRADFMWRDLGLVVEIDDRQSHDGYVAFLGDRVRDRAMAAAGLTALRFTRTEVLTSPAAVARELSRARAARS